jgi:hypothetical protein
MALAQLRRRPEAEALLMENVPSLPRRLETPATAAR